jgi:transposase
MAMFQLDGKVSLHLFVEPCDMRKQMDSLLGLIGHALAKPPQAGALYIFVNRRRCYVRIVFLDSTGVCMFSKRLFEGTVSWRWAKNLGDDQRVITISSSALHEMLHGSRAPRTTF